MVSRPEPKNWTREYSSLSSSSTLHHYLIDFPVTIIINFDFRFSQRYKGIIIFDGLNPFHENKEIVRRVIRRSIITRVFGVTRS